MSHKTLVLHIGMPKTGTTSIQETFGRHHKALLKVGVNYPRKRPYNHANTFAPIFLSARLTPIYFKQQRINTEEKLEKKVLQLKRYWESQFRKNSRDIFIISAESLCKLTPQEISAVKGFVSPHFDAFKIVSYVRHPESAFKSLWGQHVKTLSHKRTSQELLDSAIKSYDYAFVGDWEAEFGKESIVVRPFDKKALLNGSLLDDFSASIGSKPGLFQKDSVQNESLGRHALALLYESNLRYPLFVDSVPNQEKGLSDKMGIFLKMLQRLDDVKFDEKIAFTAEQAAEVNKSIDIINKFISPDQKFAYVSSGVESTNLPDFNGIPKEFLIDLINEYNKYIEQLLEVNWHAQVELMNPEAGKYIRLASRVIRQILGKFGVMQRN